MTNNEEEKMTSSWRQKMQERREKAGKKARAKTEKALAKAAATLRVKAMMTENPHLLKKGDEVATTAGLVQLTDKVGECGSAPATVVSGSAKYLDPFFQQPVGAVVVVDFDK